MGSCMKTGMGKVGVIINPKAIEDTVSFTLFLPSDILPPDSAANAYGSVSLVWDKRKFYCELEFPGDGRVIYFMDYKGKHHKGVLNFNELNRNWYGDDRRCT